MIIEKRYKELEKLVFAIIQKHFKKYIHIKDDMFGAGMLGVVKAEKSYNEEYGVKFSTYAYRCILNEIAQMIRAENKHNIICSEKKKKINIDDIDINKLEEIILTLNPKKKQILYNYIYKKETLGEVEKIKNYIKKEYIERE